MIFYFKPLILFVKKLLTHRCRRDVYDLAITYSLLIMPSAIFACLSLPWVAHLWLLGIFVVHYPSNPAKVTQIHLCEVGERSASFNT
jgi:hypothetical protein